MFFVVLFGLCCWCWCLLVVGGYVVGEFGYGVGCFWWCVWFVVGLWYVVFELVGDVVVFIDFDEGVYFCDFVWCG